MNYDSLLNIINVIIKNEEKLEESPNEIYSLFKKHGYERDIETLKLDLRNLLDDVIKSDEELSKVAGGKVSKLAAGAVAALTCFPMNSFASGTANTNQNKHSTVTKITESIKSGAKKVGDATKEYVIEPVKDTAKTIVRNPGKSAGVATVVGLAYLLGVLSGKKLAPPPKVNTQGMTEEEKQTVDDTYQVLKELTENSYIVIEDKTFSWDLSTLKEKPKGLTGGTIKIGELASRLMPEKDGSTNAYTSARNKYIEYEKALLKTLEKQKQKIEEEQATKVTQLEEENAEIKKQAKQKEEELKKKQEELEKQKKEHEELLKEKENENAELTTKNADKDRQITDLNEQLRTHQLEYNTNLRKKDTQIDELQKEAEKQASERETLSADYDQLCGENKMLTERLDKLAPDPKKAARNVPMLPSFPKIKTIRGTIDKALNKYDKNINEFNTVVRKGGKSAYNALRGLSNQFNEKNPRPMLSERWSDFKGAFSLAEILLVTPTTPNVLVKDESNLAPINTGGFNLAVTRYKTNNDLRKAATDTQTWLEWLKPSWSLTRFYGIRNDSVVAQLPELILAASTLTNEATLASLLTALQRLLTLTENSGYRKNVNNALSKVGMRFDTDKGQLVSAT